MSQVGLETYNEDKKLQILRNGVCCKRQLGHRCMSQI